MDPLSPQFVSALLAIVVIDLVLAGDNAIVIALAARKLAVQLRKRAIVWGTLAAIAVRAVMSVAAVALLKIPGLQAGGGLLLVWIAYRVLVPSNGSAAKTTGAKRRANGFWSAIRTIVIADTVMGVDNVLGVAGAARGSFGLVLLGLLISVPIMVWGSALILRLVDRYAATSYVGAGVLAWTAALMLVSDPLLEHWFASPGWLPWILQALLVAAVLVAGLFRNRSKAQGSGSDPAAGS